MSWERAEPVGKAAQRERITIAIRAHASREKPSVYMEVSVGRGMMRIMSWEIGQRVSLLWGEGKDFGWFRLEAQPDGFKLRDPGKRGSTACIMSTSQIHRAASLAPHGSGLCKWRIRESGLEIAPPLWFWRTESVYKSAEKAATNSADKKNDRLIV